MTCATLRLFTAALMVVFATAATASAQNLVPNGDFETAAGASWASDGAGTEFSFPAAGGNGGGFGQIDQTAAGWGGVLVSDISATEGHSLGSLGLTAGTEYTFTIDMIDLAANGRGAATFAGMKIESWGGGAQLEPNSGDVVFGLTGSWDTYTFTYTLDAAATEVKFVPLMVGQAVGSSVGFDNVGVFGGAVIPEPSSLALFSLGVFGLVARRRRK